jgi:ketosteroid isomerase-like protein
MTRDTQKVARRYFDAWTSGDRDAVEAVLAPGFRFSGGGMAIEGRDAFLSTGAFPPDATTEMVAEAYQDDVGFQMYDARRGERSVRVVEQLTVRDGMIASSVFVTDMAAFGAFGAP